MISRTLFLAIGATASISLSLAAATVGLDTTLTPHGHSAAHVDMNNIHTSHKQTKRVSLGKVNGHPVMAYFYEARGSADGQPLAKRSVEPSGCGDDDDDHQHSLPSLNDQSNRTVINMSPDLSKPAECTSVVCYSGAFEVPDRMDCDAIAARQLSQSNAKDLLLANPGSFTWVLYRSCAVIFQNPSFNSNYALQYKWSFLGNIVLKLSQKCFQSTALSIGGACRYSGFGHYKFENVLISLQRVLEPPPNVGASPQVSVP